MTQTAKSPIEESAEAFARRFPKIAKMIPNIRNHPEIVAGQRKAEALELELQSVRKEIYDGEKRKDAARTDAEILLAGESLPIIPTDRTRELRRLERGIEEAIELQRHRNGELWRRLVQEASADLQEDARSLLAAVVDAFESALSAIDDFDGFLSYTRTKGFKPAGRPAWWELAGTENAARQGGFVEPLSRYIAWRREQAGIDRRKS